MWNYAATANVVRIFYQHPFMVTKQLKRGEMKTAAQSNYAAIMAFSLGGLIIDRFYGFEI